MIQYIPFEMAIAIHDNLIEQYGGLKGVLNEGLLHSALEMPKASFNGRDLHRTIFDKTAAYLFHIVQNHPFTDGNKRTGSIIALSFFDANYKKEFFISDTEYQDLILGVAKGIITKTEIAKFFRQRCATSSKRDKKRSNFL